MQSFQNYKRLFVLLAIVAIFSTVAPDSVFAEDTSLITNVVYSSQSTGGISQKGADGQDGERGQDGEDGKKGQDGQPGKSGSSVSTEDGKSSPSLGTKVAPQEVKVLNIVKTQSSHDEESFVFATHTATSSAVVAQIALQKNTNGDESSVSVFSELKEALLSLRLMLVTYVNVFF